MNYEDDVLIFEKFLLGRKIGAGSFGSILLGTDIETAKLVAIKFVRYNILLIVSIGKTQYELSSSVTVRS